MADGFDPGTAFTALLGVDPEPLRADRSKLREHVAFVRSLIDPVIRGRKRDWLTTREMAWVSGVSERTMKRSLAKLRKGPSGPIRRPLTAAAVRNLAARCANVEAGHYLEAAALALES